MLLTAAQIDQFYEIGFLVLENVFFKDEINRIKGSLERIAKLASHSRTTFESKGTQFVVENQRIDRVVWCAGIEPDLLKISHDRRLLQPVSQILGSSRLTHLICQAHFKFPKDGVEFPWHQDSEHRKFGTNLWNDLNGRGSFVQSILAIDPITLENGPVKFVPRSGMKGHLYLEAGKIQRSVFDSSQFETPTLASGSMVLFGPYTVHGSSPNQSTKPRRIFINGFCYPGANFFSYPGCGYGFDVDCY